jgi:hypothetical protein
LSELHPEGVVIGLQLHCLLTTVIPLRGFDVEEFCRKEVNMRSEKKRSEKKSEEI